jgi:hypothetical protein
MSPRRTRLREKSPWNFHPLSLAPVVFPRWVWSAPEAPQRLRQLLQDNVLLERREIVPYLPGLRVPDYLPLGRLGAGPSMAL